MEDESVKMLVVYYSLSGNTEKIAKAIAVPLAADVESIRDKKPRRGVSGMLRSLWQAVFKLTPEIAPSAVNAADYDLVVLGCPVWGRDMAAPMRAYLSREHKHIKQFALFCTFEGTGAERAFQQMAALAGGPPVAQWAITEGDLKSGKDQAAVAAFVQAIKAVET